MINSNTFIGTINNLTDININDYQDGDCVYVYNTNNMYIKNISWVKLEASGDIDDSEM